MTSSIIVNGAFGKMGKTACQAIESAPNFTLQAKLGRQDDLLQAINGHKPNMVIEFTNANVVYENTQLLLSHGMKTVVGASGLNNDQISALTQLASDKNVGCIIAPNFSIGAILMMQFSSIAAKYFSEAEIIETHHQQKLDAPSGTAVKTAEMIEDARIKQKNACHSEVHYPGARGANISDTQVHSLRLPGYIASQQVCFGDTGENLTISHNSISRDCFMPGIIMACNKLQSLNHLVYGLENLLD